MRANELMMNDWVFAYNYPVRVTSLSLLGGDVVGILKEFSSIEEHFADNAVALSRGAKPIKLIKPIPLTEEVLKANGFVKNCLHYDDNHYIVYDKTNKHIRMYSIINDEFQLFFDSCVLFVHEFQYTLRLFWLNEFADNFRME